MDLLIVSKLSHTLDSLLHTIEMHNIHNTKFVSVDHCNGM